jgi:pyruvate,water dikinase
VEGGRCDEYIISRNGQLMSEHIESEKPCLFFSGASIVSRLAPHSGSVLNAHEIKKLMKLAFRIEMYFGCPQDIEWCIYRKRVSILQARPVTRKISEGTNPVFYDSANIAESYSGIVLPLTLSFAAHIYKVVYENLLHASGVSWKKITRHKPVFDEMVASFYGRMYYNMNNWYLMMAFAPGYRRNKRNLEEMITSNVREDIVRSVSPSVGLRMAYPLIFLVKLALFPSMIRKFKRRVREELLAFRSTDIKSLGFDDCVLLYAKLNRRLLRNWHIPVENDFLVMSYFGILKTKLPENKLEELIGFSSFSGSQIMALSELSNAFQKSRELWQAVNAENEIEFDTLLSAKPEMKNLLVGYFEKYGGRFANELKLESPDIEENKSRLFTLLKNYANVMPGRAAPKKRRVTGSVLVNYALRKFKQYAAQREELRLLRSNCFAVTRKLFNQMGALLAEEKIIERRADVFYLTINELFDKTLKASGTLAKKIAERKADYEKYRSINPPVFFNIRPGEMPELDGNVETAAETLYGRPCTPGTVRGRVKIFPEYFLPGVIDFDIIVTRHTDPGWTTLIGLCKGLIIEHGGILSHAAIVSRELGIPTIIGVRDATRLLKDGATVTLKATEGKVLVEQG